MQPTNQKLDFLLMLLDNDNNVMKKLLEGFYNILQSQNLIKKFSTITVCPRNLSCFVPIQLFVNEVDHHYVNLEKVKNYTLAVMKKYIHILKKKILIKKVYFAMWFYI